MKQKRLVTVQDISCLGKCSLGAAMPIISAFGIETVVLPTAVLSTHTGRFEGYTFKDMTDEMPKIVSHWKSLGIEFDAMYSGYFGKCEQLEIVSGFFSDFKSDGNLVFVDPVLGDEGRLYTGFDGKFVDKMRDFCRHADVLTPNITEAALISGMPYRENCGEEYAEKMALSLSDTGAKLIVVTGISEGSNSGAMCYDANSGKTFSYYRKSIEGTYYGTGDIFASVLCGALTSGADFERSLRLAVDFVHAGIVNTQDEREKFFYGVKFEQSLAMLTNFKGERL